MISGAARPAIFALALLGSACSTESMATGDEPGAAGASGRTGGASTGGKSSSGTGGASSPAGAAPSDNAGASGGTNVAGMSAAGGQAVEPPRSRQKLEPEDGKTLLLVGQDTGEIESYMGALGMPGGVMLYSNIWDGLGVLQPSDFGGYGWSDLPHWRGTSEKLVLQIGLDLDHGQNCGSCAGCSRAGYLEQLASGDGVRVALVRAVAEALRDSGKPVLLRVGYEFDAEICPGGFGKYPMQAYQDAFRRVRDILDEVGADQVALVWNAWAFQARDPSKAAGIAPWGWYPGDDVVDWIGVSVFPGWVAGHPTEQQQADKRRQLAEFARSHGKPLMIAEASPRARFAPAQGEVAWQGWFSGVFEYVETNQVKAFSYINMNWEALGMWTGRGWGDSRVQGSAIAEQWKGATSDARFLKSSETLYQELGL